ncbi:hypothetical protein OPV22_009063 [Ensete ventricosum]|uniref:Uncharacterized protein n=1 Tax=Ensete ventricosum TaxID=4639 RepID=A0AAV8R805_ENSVE|nr:hypothetical protein OPV22_009063 [Ensete ventricosum]
MGFPSLGGGQLDVRKEKLFPDHKIGIPRAPFRLRRRSHNHTPNRLLPKHPSPTPPAIASVPSQSYPTRYPESKATRVDSSSASFNGLSHRNDNWGPLKNLVTLPLPSASCETHDPHATLSHDPRVEPAALVVA